MFDFEKDYVSEVVSQLRFWREFPGELMEKSRGAVERYRYMQDTSTESLKNIFSIMTAA